MLDYGCGAGNVTEKIAKLNPEKLVGIDISEVSVKRAIEKAKDQNLLIEYSVDNCENTKLNEKTFDLSVKNPNLPEEAPLKEPKEILAEIENLDSETKSLLKSIKDLL